MDLETLTLRGIRSYVSEQTVDFRGKSLVGVVGNTGAGKSTLLEAIVFGLYGQSSWADRGTGKYISLISDGEQAMKVEVVFGHDGERWKVTRTGNRSGTANARLENLGTGYAFNGVVEVTAQVSRILGMKLDAFLSVVLLAQGEFDRLLNAPSAKRPLLLKEVLGTEALSDARQQADKHHDSINELLGEAQRQRDRLYQDPALEAERAAAEAEKSQARVVDLGAIHADVTALLNRHATVSTRAAALDGALTELAKRAGRENSTDLDDLETRELQYVQDSASLNVRRRAAEEALASAEGELGSLSQNGLTVASAARAQGFLARAPQQTGELSAARATLDEEQGTLSEHEALLNTRKTALDSLAARARQAQAEATQVQEHCDQLGMALTALRTSVGTVLGARGRLTKAQEAVERSLGRHASLVDAATAAHTDLATGERGLTAAKAALRDGKLVKNAGAQLEKVRDSVRRALSEAQAAGAAQQHQMQLQAALTDTASRDRLAARVKALRTEMSHKRALLETWEAADDAADKALATVRRAITAYHGARAEPDDLRAALAEVVRADRAAQAGLRTAAESAARAVAQYEEALEQHSAVLHGDHLAAIAGGLVPGGACPVCQGDLPADFEAPSPQDPDAISTATQRLRAAEKTRATADRKHNDAAALAGATAAKVQAAQASLDDAFTRVDGLLAVARAAWRDAAEVLAGAQEPVSDCDDVDGLISRDHASVSAIIAPLARAHAEISRKLEEADQAVIDAAKAVTDTEKEQATQDALHQAAQAAAQKAANITAAAESSAQRALTEAAATHHASTSAFEDLGIAVACQEDEFAEALGNAADRARRGTLDLDDPTTANHLTEAVRQAHETLTAQTQTLKSSVDDARRTLQGAQRTAKQCDDAVEQAAAALNDLKAEAGQSEVLLESALNLCRSEYAAALDLCTRAGVSEVDKEDAFSRRLRECAQDPSSAEHAVRTTESLTEQMRSAHQALTGRLSKAKSDSAILAEQTKAEKKALEKETKANATAQKRNTHALEVNEKSWSKIEQEIQALPVPLRTQLTVRARELTADNLMQAVESANETSRHLNELEQAHNTARSRLTECADLQRKLENERDAQVGRPLREILAQVRSTRDTAVRLSPMLADQVIDAPRDHETEPTPGSIRTFASAVTVYCGEVHQAFSAAVAGCRTERQDILDGLSRQRLRLRDLDGSLELGEDLTAPGAMENLVVARGLAQQHARDALKTERTARAQIEPAAALDVAIRAGQSRREALKIIKSHLTPGRFLNHLADKRTGELLGVASELFGELSEGRFGFAAEFQIASRLTSTARDPKTLSGGETFLASLALALAMVEIHGHRGPRLGALFLDEGFGALDTASLETALATLHKQVGEERLVVVISHLRPVAEAVHDVLWAERLGSGSTVRWLEGRELADFLYDESDTGLLSPR